MNKIAIIPAKAKSSRIPNKNMRDFKGLPLFLWSVEAALDAGVKPVVYTDSDEIEVICKEKQVEVVRRDEAEDEEMENAVRSVLNKVQTDAFVLLQPTSPLRVPGLIMNIFDKMERGDFDSAYTFSKVKPIGHFGDNFYRGGRDQVIEAWIKWFDGNMIWCKVDYFKTHGTFLTKDSYPVENIYPCVLQLDWPAQWDTLESIARKRKNKIFLPGTIRTVAVVSNKDRFVRNYSQFIDSCDVVMRVNRMTNWYTGTAGTRTDVCLVENSVAYFCYANWNRKSDKLLEIPIVWHKYDERTEKWHKAYPFNNGVLLPHYAPASKFYTTYMCAIDLVLSSWSRCHVYGIGTMDVRARTGEGFCFHKHSPEAQRMMQLVQEGKLTIVDEDSIPIEESDKCKYST